MEYRPKVNHFLGPCALAAVLVLAVLAAGCGRTDAHAEGRVAPRNAASGVDSLVILHTNDVHSHLDPFDVGGRLVGGAAARATLIAREKALGGRVILLDGGDLVQGTPYYNQFRGEPDHKILDRLGYDAIVLGNHDLDDGADAWLKRAATTRTPILSANVMRVSPDGDVPVSVSRTAKWVGGGNAAKGTRFKLIAKPYVILERGGLKIAVLGLTTYALDRIVAARPNKGIAVASPVATAHLWVPRLRKEADIVIALTHLGVDQDRALADRVPGIDIIIGGHSHTPLFRPIQEKAEGGRATPIAQAGSWGRYLGRTTLRWAGVERLRLATGRLIEVHPSDGEDERLLAIVTTYRRRLGSGLERVAFRSPARVEMTDRREGDHPLGNFVSDVLRERTKADLGVMNAGGIRAPLPAGDVRERDIVSMLPFDNRLVVVELTGAQIRRLLDRFASKLGRSGFGHVSGVSYTIQGGRAIDIRVWPAWTRVAPGAWRGRSAGPGEPLDGQKHYRVATIDFLANGGDYFDELRSSADRESTDILLSDAAIAFLRDHPDYRFVRDGRVQWRGSGEALRGLRTR